MHWLRGLELGVDGAELRSLALRGRSGAGWRACFCNENVSLM